MSNRTVVMVGALYRSIAGFVSEAQAQVVTDYMHEILHAKSIEVDLEYYENSQYYDTFHLRLIARKSSYYSIVPEPT